MHYILPFAIHPSIPHPHKGDGGADFIGRLDVDAGFARTKLVVLGQAKCGKPNSPTGGMHIARKVLDAVHFGNDKSVTEYIESVDSRYHEKIHHARPEEILKFWEQTPYAKR